MYSCIRAVVSELSPIGAAIQPGLLSFQAETKASWDPSERDFCPEGQKTRVDCGLLHDWASISPSKRLTRLRLGLRELERTGLMLRLRPLFHCKNQTNTQIKEWKFGILVCSLKIKTWKSVPQLLSWLQPLPLSVRCLPPLRPATRGTSPPEP